MPWPGACAAYFIAVQRPGDLQMHRAARRPRWGKLSACPAQCAKQRCTALLMLSGSFTGGRRRHQHIIALMVSEQHCLMMLAYPQEGAGPEPAAKRRRIDAAAAASTGSQLPTQPLHAPPEAAAQQPLGAEERSMLVGELLALAKQTGPAGEQKHQQSIMHNI